MLDSLTDKDRATYEALKGHIECLVGLACHKGPNGVVEHVTVDGRLIRVRLSLVDVENKAVFR